MWLVEIDDLAFLVATKEEVDKHLQARKNTTPCRVEFFDVNTRFARLQSTPRQ